MMQLNRFIFLSGRTFPSTDHSDAGETFSLCVKDIITVRVQLHNSWHLIRINNNACDLCIQPLCGRYTTWWSVYMLTVCKVCTYIMNILYIYIYGCVCVCVYTYMHNNAYLRGLNKGKIVYKNRRLGYINHVLCDRSRQILNYFVFQYFFLLCLMIFFQVHTGHNLWPDDKGLPAINFSSIIGRTEYISINKPLCCGFSAPFHRSFYVYCVEKPHF